MAVSVLVLEPAVRIIIHPGFQELINTLFMMFSIIFIHWQDAAILENGPGCNRHVAVLVPEPADRNFK